jgi:hypothetical protein
MSRFTLIVALATAAVATLAPTAAHADRVDPVACSINVEYTLNNAVRLSYVKDFVVSVDAPFSDDFSNAIRFRFFDAFLTVEDGLPVVGISFDADVSVFNAVAFDTTFKLRDQSHPATTSGRSGFFSSAPGAAGSHRTTYTLTCERAN